MGAEYFHEEFFGNDNAQSKSVISIKNSFFVNSTIAANACVYYDYTYKTRNDIGFKQFNIDNNIYTYPYPYKFQACNNLNPLDRDPIDFGGVCTKCVSKIYLEFKTIYIPRDFPIQRSKKFLMFNLRLYKDFGIRVKK